MFSVNAGSARVQSFDWHYKGYRAWFQVCVAIAQQVEAGGPGTNT